jgi:hypothetical protein
MWFYFLVFSLISFFCYTNIKQKEVIFWFLVALLICVAGFSGNVSRDHAYYLLGYKNVLNGKYVGEYSFKLIVLLVNKLFHNSLYLFLIYAILGVTLKAIAIKRLTKFWFFSLLIYFSFYFFLHEMTQLRAGVASAIILLSIPAIYNRKIWQFLLIAFLAFFFHFSALALFPLYFLSRNKIQIWFYLLIPIGYLLYFTNANLVSLVHIINIDIVNLKFALYKQNFGTQRINIFNLLMIARYIFCALLLWKWKLLQEKNNYSVLLIKIYIISCFIFIALADIPIIAFRVSELLAIVEIVLIPLLIQLFTIRLHGKILVVAIGFLFLCFILFYDKIVISLF